MTRLERKLSFQREGKGRLLLEGRGVETAEF